MLPLPPLSRRHCDATPPPQTDRASQQPHALTKVLTCYHHRSPPPTHDLDRQTIHDGRRSLVFARSVVAWLILPCLCLSSVYPPLLLFDRSSIFEHNSSQRSQVDEPTHEIAADSRRCAGATSTPALLHQARNGRQGAQSAVVRLVHAPCVARGTSAFCSSFVSGSATAAGRLRHRHRDWQQQ